jgi:hypothetical protein
LVPLVLYFRPKILICFTTYSILIAPYDGEPNFSNGDYDMFQMDMIMDRDEKVASGGGQSMRRWQAFD